MAKIDLEKFVCSLIESSPNVSGRLLDALDKQGLRYWDGKLEYLLAEPKFTANSWVVWECGDTEKILQIEKVDTEKHCYKFTDGTTLSFSDEDSLHKWTYMDAKNGDVLVSENEDIVIFKECNFDGFNGSMSVHCCYDMFNNTIACYGFACLNPSIFLPATDEQMECLYKKLAEVGYEWAPEYKRLQRVPLFKPNDVIRWKLFNERGIPYYVDSVDEEHQCYRLSNGESLPFDEQKDYELVATETVTTPAQEDKVMVVYKYNANDEDVIAKLSFLSMKYPTRVFLDFYVDGDHSESILFSLNDISLYLYFDDKDEELLEIVEKDYVLNSKWYDTDSFDMPAEKMERLVKATKNTKMLLTSLQRTNDRLVQDVKNLHTK